MSTSMKRTARNNRFARPLAALLFLLGTAAHAAPAVPDAKESDGAVRSVMASTHITFGKLGIGALATEIGPYLDEKEIRQHGLHASLSISVAQDPAAHQEVALVVGQTITVGGYRIKVEHINPGNRGSAVLRLWAPPPEPAKPTKKWPFSWFNFGKD